MRRSLPRACRQASLSGWWLWLLALTPLFSVVTFDTWLNTQSLRNDYEIAAINKQVKEFRENLDGLKVKEASLESLDRIEMEAPDLGLVEPEPGQIRIIYSLLPLDEPSQEKGTEGDVGSESFTIEFERILKDYMLEKNAEGKSWQTNSESSLASITPAGNLLRKAFSSAYAFYVGHS